MLLQFITKLFQNKKQENTKCFSKFLPRLIICGYERGGTTLLSEILKNNGYASGFECGVLMCDSPNQFKKYEPFYTNFKRASKLDNNFLNLLCEMNFKNFYLNFYKKVYKKNNLKFFDKTPIYMKELGGCLNKATFINKAIVIYRDPRELYWSYYKREVLLNPSLDKDKFINNFVKRYLEYFLGSIANLYNKKILFISYEKLCLETKTELSKIEKFLNIKKIKSSNLNIEYSNNVKNNCIDSSFLMQFKGKVSKKDQLFLLDNLKIAAIFFNSDMRSKYYKYWLSFNNYIQEIINNKKINSFNLYGNKYSFDRINNIIIKRK